MTTELTPALARFPSIDHWLRPWLDQLFPQRGEEYVVLIDELLDDATGHESTLQNLTLLNDHLAQAATSCQDLKLLIYEKAKLPQDLDEANKTVLDKLAEVRAIFGLARLGYEAIKFTTSPDLSVVRKGTEFAVEVTRFGVATGRKREIWDAQGGSLESGLWMGMASQTGKLPAAIAHGIRGAVARKAQQLKHSGIARHGIVWISLGRDYITASKYETRGLGGLASRMPSTLRDALELAANSLPAEYNDQPCSYEHVDLVVLSPGRERRDLVLRLGT